MPWLIDSLDCKLIVIIRQLIETINPDAFVDKHVMPSIALNRIATRNIFTYMYNGNICTTRYPLRWWRAKFEYFLTRGLINWEGWKLFNDLFKQHIFGLPVSNFWAFYFNPLAPSFLEWWRNMIIENISISLFQRKCKCK